MPKKTFKDKTDHLDQFFSDAHDTQNIHGADTMQDVANTQQAHREADVYDVPDAYDGQAREKERYRLNLKLRPECKKHLQEASWRARKSVTEYINDLIMDDMKRINNKEI